MILLNPPKKGDLRIITIPRNYEKRYIYYLVLPQTS